VDSVAVRPVEVEQVAAGERKVLSSKERSRVEAAVARAERATGLQFLTYLGPGGDDPAAAAHALLTQQGYASVPAVVVFVAPDNRSVQIVTSEGGRQRVSDEACARAVEVMVPLFKKGKWIDGIEQGIALIAAEAGPGEEDPASELPDILE
jgi:uncharacterized membrane protein